MIILNYYLDICYIMFISVVDFLNIRGIGKEVVKVKYILLRF